MTHTDAARLTTLVLAAVASAAPVTAAEPEDDIDFYLANQFTWDDNLYRLPDGTTVVLDEGREREDYVHRLSAGVDKQFIFSQQKLSLDARIDDNSYRYNTGLDHTGGRARADWGWRIGDRLSGHLGGDYTRALAGFANTRLLIRDLVEARGGFWDGALKVGSHWQLTAGARHVETEHSAIERRYDNATSTTVSGGVRYETSLDHVFGWRAWRTESEARTAPAEVNRVDRSFDENASNLYLRYAFSEKTLLEGSAGYLEREYPNAIALASSPDTLREGYSGGIWDASLEWRPSMKTGFTFAGWRKLRAHFDAESDYFVATGGGITAEWEPTAKIGLSLDVSREERRYIAASSNLLTAEPRNDRVNAAEFLLSWRPLRLLHLDLTYRLEQRDSDRARLDYDNQLAALGVRINL